MLAAQAALIHAGEEPAALGVGAGELGEQQVSPVACRPVAMRTGD